MERPDSATLVTAAVDDARRLVALEMKLLRLEVASFGSRLKRVAALTTLAGMLGIPAGVCLALSIASALYTQADLPLWLAFLSTMALFIVASATAGWLAKSHWEKTKKESNDGSGT